MFKKHTKHKQGFTIVELLVVIVVIGILAAITIVAYSAVQNSARAAAAKSAVSQAAKKVASDAVTRSDDYAASLGDAGVNTESSDTLYEYSYNNSTSPKTFCITATVDGVSYYQNNTTVSVPTSGTCPGHTGGVVPTLTFTERTGSGSRNWLALAINSDASRIYALVRSSSTAYVSTNDGASWSTASGPSSSATSIAGSSDGTRLIAGTYTLSGSITITSSGDIRSSTNSGSSWSSQAGAAGRPWVDVTMSANGTRLAAVSDGPIVDDYSTEGNVWTSSDSGATWTQRPSAGTRMWTSIASSADGTRLVAGTWNGYVYTSTDSGVTWVERTSGGTNTWSSLAISDDGMKILGNGFYGTARVSLDGGATWTSLANATSYGAMSADGTVMVRGGREGSSTPTALYVSTDSGVTWTANDSAGTRRWAGFAVSDDGTKFVAITTNGYIYTGSY